MTFSSPQTARWRITLTLQQIALKLSLVSTGFIIRLNRPACKGMPEDSSELLRFTCTASMFRMEALLTRFSC